MSKTEIELISSEHLGEKYYDIHHKSGLRVFVFPKKFSTCYGILGTKFGAIDRAFVGSNGKKIKLLPIAHPRQIGALGAHSEKWNILHKEWERSKEKQNG